VVLAGAGSSSAFTPSGPAQGGVIAASAGPTIATITLPYNPSTENKPQPTGLAYYAGGNKLFVADNANGKLLMINGVTHNVDNSLSVGGAVYSDAMFVDEADAKVFVGSQDTGVISVVNANTGTLITTIDPADNGGKADWFQFAGDSVHGKLYFSFYCAGCTNALDAINTATNAVTPVMLRTDVEYAFTFGFGVMGANTTTNEAFAVDAKNLYVVKGSNLTWTKQALDPYGQPLSFAVNPVQNKLYFWFNACTGGCDSGVVELDRSQAPAQWKVLEPYGDKEPLVFDTANDTLFSGAQVDQQGIIVDGSTDAVTHVDFGDGGMMAGAVRSSTDNAYFASPLTTFISMGSTKFAQPLVTVHTIEEIDGGVFASSVAIDQTHGLVYAVNDDQDGVISVIEDGPPETLTVSEAGAGTGRVTSSPPGIDCGSDFYGSGATCSRPFAYLSQITLTANPDFVSGSTFTGWSGACSGTGACTVSMDDARSVTASFSLPSKMLSVWMQGDGAGTVTSSPTGIDCGSTCLFDFAYGSSVSLHASPQAGSTFAGWSGDCSGSGTCTVTMSGSRSVGATFMKQATTTTKTTTTTSGGGGSAPKCVVPKVKGKTLTAAKTAIKKAHCSVGKVTKKASAKVKKNHVISQKPSPGKRLAKGSKVSLVVSKGKKHAGSSPAQANTTKGVTYHGTADGGTVSFVVSADDTAVTQFRVKNVATTCGTISVTSTGTFTISGESFSYGTSSTIGFRFRGSFTGTRKAKGVLSYKSAFPSCTSSDVNWTATTSG
jgi:hypothetical protein